MATNFGQSFTDGLSTLFYLVPPHKMEYESFSELPKYVENAVPFFVLLAAVELGIGALRGIRTYDFKDTLMSFALGSFQQMFQALFGTMFLSPYLYVYEHYRLLDMPTRGWVSWTLCLMACDLAYYWFHRVAHEWHVVWAAHSVHHSGQHYNLTTALRQGAMQGLWSWSAYLPMALLGFHPVQMMAHKGLNLLYQFWIHTEMIGHIGVLELVLNTPSHHRMHHRPPGNCNYAGVLIIWDRMFGTFVAEDRQIRSYGLAKPLASYNPVTANVEHFRRLVSSGTGKGTGNVLMRRWRHAPVFDPTRLFSFEWRTKGNLWAVEDRSEIAARGGDKTYRVPLYYGADISGNLALMAHLALHWLVTIALTFHSMAVKSRLGDMGFRLMFVWMALSFYSLGNIMSAVTPGNIRVEDARMAMLAACCCFFVKDVWWLAFAMGFGEQPPVLELGSPLCIVVGGVLGLWGVARNRVSAQSRLKKGE